jgi:hypothetical protein
MTDVDAGRDVPTASRAPGSRNAPIRDPGRASGYGAFSLLPSRTRAMPFAACRYVMTEAIVDMCPGGLNLVCLFLLALSAGFPTSRD